MDFETSDKHLKIFTLNCWGLLYVSQHRQQRIESIAQHLIQHNYDIVFLQEIWCDSDYQYLKTQTKSKFRFSHKFSNASALGTSGLVVLTSWMPLVFHFQPFSINGSPFRPWHGDWFTSKGIGYVRLELDEFNVHLFCTHMHAQYRCDERECDQYFIHRICQSYQLSKFINLMTKHNHTKRKNLVILAGDLNSSSKQLPYKLLLSMTGLVDCYNPRLTSPSFPSNCDVNEKLGKKDIIAPFNYEHLTDSYDTDDELITCGHYNNSFTRQAINPKDNDAKRIDFIMYSLVSNDYNEIISINENPFCTIDHIKCLSKNPESGLSFSDHQPVAVKLIIRYNNINYREPYLKALNNTKYNLETELEQSTEKPILTNDKHMEGDGISMVAGNKKSYFGHFVKSKVVGEGNGKMEVNAGVDVDAGDSYGEAINKHDLIETDSNRTEQLALLTEKRKFKSNILLDLTENGSKSTSKSGPLQLKHAPNNEFKSNLSLTNQSKVCSKSKLLDYTKSLLDNYLRDNDIAMKNSLILFGFFLIFIYLMLFSVIMLTSITTITVLFSIFILTAITLIFIGLKYLAFHYEQNAVKAIINDINNEIFLSSNL